MASLDPNVPIEDIPALAPPPGVQPNFVNPQSYEHSIIILEGIFVPLMLLAVFTRVFVRARITKMWGWDDSTCIIATCGALAHLILYVKMFSVGFGRHLWDIRAVTLLDAHNARLLSSDGITYPFVIFFVRLSIMLLYLRIFNVNRALRLSTYIGIIFQALFYSAMIGLAIGSIVECSGPAQATQQFCINYGKPVVALNAVFNVVADIYVLLLPIPQVLKLQLSNKHRMGLLLVFSTGALTCAVSITRLAVFCVNFNDPDVLWVQGRNAQFTVVEIYICIIVACAPCFPAFAAKTKIFSGSVISLLRSRFTIITRATDTSAHPSTTHDSTVAKKASASNDGWYGDKARLKDDTYFELRDTQDFGGVSVVGDSIGRDKNGTENEFVLDDKPGILRTMDYDIESCPRE